MVNQVKKRDGRVEAFDSARIFTAVSNAMKSVGVVVDENLINDIITKISESPKAKMSVEDIQDFIEKYLMEQHQYDTVRSFILYREKHKELRSILEKEEFMNYYIASSNAATGSKYDSNANVTEKNIATLNGEIPKLDYLRLNRKRVVEKLKELYPNFNYKQYEKDLNKHIIYKHDESSAPGLYPYTYSAKEVVNVKYNDLPYLLSMESLYDLVQYPEKLLDEEQVVYGKFPENLYIQDKDGKYTKISRLIRKKRHRDLVCVKTEHGENLVVTDNHPLIVSEDKNDTIEAIDSIDKPQLRVKQKFEFLNKKEIDAAEIVPYDEKYNSFILTRKQTYSQYASLKRFIKLDEEFGYVVGFFIGDGWFKNDEFSESLMFCQKEKETLEYLADVIYRATGCTTLITEKNNKENNLIGWKAEVKSFGLYYIFKNYFKIKDYAQNKNLPINLFWFSREFVKGLIEGLIDSDGSIGAEAVCDIRLSSRECILQVSSLLKEFGYTPKNSWCSAPFGTDKNEQKKTIHGNYSLWGVSFSNKENAEQFELSYKWKRITKLTKPKYKEGWCNISKVTKIPDNDYFLKQNDYIYDITTESNTFISNNIWVHNCCAVSMYPYLLRGLQDIGGLSAAPKNLDSFCGMFLHLVFALASQFAGAVAFGEFFNCFDYYARKEWGDHYYKHDQKPAHLKYDKDENGNYVTNEVSISKQIEQYFQQIVYGLNQPAGNRSYQSPFTNVSYYDKNYWDALFADFYFPDGTKPQWESVSYLQKKFMKWFNKERTKCVLTFPVETMALLSDGKDKVLDEEYAEFTAEMYAEGHSFFTYISNNPNGLSSCCFTGDVKPVYQIESDKEYEMGLDFADLARLYPDAKFKIFQQNPITCDGEWKHAKFVQSAVNQIVKITLEDILEPITCTVDHIFPTKKKGDVRAEHLEVGDKLVFNRSKMSNTIADGTLTYKKIKEIEIIQSSELVPVYCFEFEDEIMPYFLLENGLITHNCRLRNEIDKNEFSFTNGLTGVATGSKSVITLNLNRITQDANKKWYKDLKNDKIPVGQTFCNDENCYLKQYLVNILDRVYKYHAAYNELLKELQSQKMLPVYDAGFISLKQQFLTIGINGMNEAAEFLGFECSDNSDYERFVNLICSTISEQNALHKTEELKFNQEYVPAENLGVKNYRWDKEDGYKVPKDRNAYNSYFYLPDNPNTEVLEKFRLQGERYTKNLDGGVALHCNLEEHLSKEQYKHLIKYAIEQGCTYFTFNIRNTECLDCNYISKHTLDKCPKCGSQHLNQLSRVIGYLKRISNFSEARQLEASRRVYSKFDLAD